MKKLLLIILTLFSLASYSQVKQVYPQYGGTWKKLYLTDSGAFRLPIKIASTKDFNSSTPDSGQIYYDPIDSNVKVWTGTQWMNLGGSSGTWGSITGTLSDQTDLQSALDAKLNLSDTSNKWVNSITRVAGKDSIIFYIGNTRFAIKDSTGGGGGGEDLDATLALGNTSNKSILLNKAGAGDIGIIVGNDNGSGVIIQTIDDVGMINISDGALHSSILRAPIGTGGQITLPSHATGRTMPLSVNGNYADNAGNITLSAGDNISNANLTASASYTYDIAGNQQYIHNGTWLSDSTKYARINLLPSADSVSFFGNSITAGQNAASSDSAYTSRIQVGFSINGVDYSLGGAGAYYGAATANDQLYPGMTRMTTVMEGFNDLREGGNDARTYNKVINGYRSIIATHFMKSWVNAGNGTGTSRTGAWTTGYISPAVGGRGLGAYSSTVNDYIEYTFTDSSVFVQLIYGDGTSEVHSNSFEIYIDGVLQGTYSLKYGADNVTVNGHADDRIPGAFVFTGLTYASHTIKLINKEAHNLIVDIFGHLKDANDATPFILFEVPKMDATGYATAPANSSNTIVNNMNTKLDSLAATYASWLPIYVVKTNDFYDATIGSGLDADHIHPNNRGHGQIYEAMLDVFPSFVSYTPTPGTVFFSNRLYVSDSAGNYRGLAYQDEGGGGGVTTMAAVGSSPNANGGSISGSTLTLQPASASFPGVVTTGIQTFNGEKTINGGLSVQGAISSPAGAGFELEYTGGIAYVTAYNRTGAAWLPLNFRGSTATTTIGGTAKILTNSSGRTFFGGSTSATALVHLAAGTATANTAPLKIEGGTVLGTTEAGAIENDGTHLYYTATNGGTRYQLDQQSSSTKSKGLTIEFPTSAESIGMWKTPVAITVSSLEAVLVGSSTPSVTFNIAFGTDRTSGTNVFSSGRTVTSTTTGSTFNSSFNDATIPAGSFIWVTTSAQSGSVTNIELTINYTED